MYTYFKSIIFCAGLMLSLSLGYAHTPALADTAPSDTTDIKSFNTFFKGEVTSDSGLFITHHARHKHYFEIPDSVLDRDMLMVTTRVSMSSSDFESKVAGERAQPGLMLRWSKSPDGQFIFLRKVTSRLDMRFSGADTAFMNAVELQTLDPILLSFPIKALGKGGKNAIIDIQPLFLSYIKELSPFSQSFIEKLVGRPDKKYKVETDRSYIQSIKGFDQNMEVRSMLTFTETDNIYTILVNYSMVLLPREPMMGRFADDRVGYFVRAFSQYDESKPVYTQHYISRWRLEPKDEDRSKMAQGILVEPKKPIVFYIDPSTPVKWRKYIRQGVEDWQEAFEAAGFKNAIVAKDAPLNDPDFNPEDIRYSVIRYTASDIPNAKGPSVTDPRSGEILESDVIIYHNILELLTQWRFAQTAANDPTVRKGTLSDEQMGEAIRYVAAHEIGHALGLRHNMGASYAFPVDSLRSASFTQKYGTTPSIMDYARNNYVAQPEDKGVKLTPPKLGVYDKYAIHWGYHPIPTAEHPKAEIDTLNAWIAKHQDDPRYRFAEGDVNGTDPSSQRESLGDDVVKASVYGVKNVRYILSHLKEWMSEPGAKYDEIDDAYRAVLRQYERYIGHVGTAVGGIYQYYPVQGQGQPVYAYTSREENEAAVAFLLEQYHRMPQWLEALPADLIIYDKEKEIKKIVPRSTYIERLFKKSFQTELLNVGKLAYLTDYQLQSGEEAYTPADLLGDLRQDLFSEARKSPGYYDQMLQSIYVDRIIDLSSVRADLGSGRSLAHSTDMATHTGQIDPCFNPADEELHALRDEPHQAHAADQLYFQYMSMLNTDKQFKIASLALGELYAVYDIVEKRARQERGAVRNHYRYLAKRIGLFLNKTP